MAVNATQYAALVASNTAKGVSTPKGYHDKMTQKEFEAWRNEQLKASRGAR